MLPTTSFSVNTNNLVVCMTDECIAGNHNCHEKAQCENVDFGFQCSCNDGYSGDGVLCEGKTIQFI